MHSLDCNREVICVKCQCQMQCIGGNGKTLTSYVIDVYIRTVSCAHYHDARDPCFLICFTGTCRKLVSFNTPLWLGGQAAQAGFTTQLRLDPVLTLCKRHKYTG